MQHIAIMGGTFDPVHNGHLQISLKIESLFSFDHFFFMPCKIPTLKSPSAATSNQRVHMLRLALKPYPAFSIDLREIERESPSYMVLSLESYKEQFPETALTLILGYDAFLTLPQWYQWKKILKLCNLLVLNRTGLPQRSPPPELKALLKQHEIRTSNELLSRSSGAILMFNAGSYDISSTAIREAIKRQETIEHLLPSSVLQYINQQGLYR